MVWERVSLFTKVMLFQKAATKELISVSSSLQALLGKNLFSVTSKNIYWFYCFDKCQPCYI